MNLNTRWLQVEATTKCNAWCPACGRNQGGFGLSPHLVIEDLDLSIYHNHLESMPNLEVIDFCGTYGDAIAAHNIVELTRLSKQYAKKIVVRTNGSLRSTTWWQEYAALFKDIDHEIWFCIDGLKDTHSIYRQGTDFDTIMANAATVIAQGCSAVWQFIPWEHNQHQIKDCIRLSQQLGFERFEFIKNVRRDFVPRHWKTGKVFEIKPWQHNSEFNMIEQPRTQLDVQDCRHLTQPSLYLNANGKLSNCCFFNTGICATTADQLPNIEQELNNPRDICLHYCGH